MIEKPTELSCIAGAVISCASPLLGDYAILATVAVFGSIAALSMDDEPRSPKKTLWFIYRSVTIATVMSSVLAALLSKATGLPLYMWLTPVAFGLAWGGEKLLPSLLKAARKRIGGDGNEEAPE